MEIVLSLGLVLVGGVIGFFVARHWYNRGPSQESISQAENNLKSLLAQQSENHVYQTKQMVQSIEKQCLALHQQLEAYEGLLSSESDQQSESVPFYGEQASSYLRNKLSSNKFKLSDQSDTQPRDFAAAGSGLFSDKAEVVVEKDEGTN